MAALSVGEKWTGDTLAKWTNMSAPTDDRGARVVEGTFAGRHAFALTAYADDVAPRTPTANPRAELVTPPLMVDGGTYRIGLSFRVPAGALPTSLPSGTWIELLQFAYGPPFAGSPAHRLWTRDGATIGERLADGPFDWQAPLERDVWWNVDYGVKLSRNLNAWPDCGYHWLAAYKDGTPYKTVVPAGGGNAPPERTIIDSMKTGPWSLHLNAYMCAGAAAKIGPVLFSPVTISRTG